MDIENEIMRAKCKKVVDDLWRSMLNFATQGSASLGEECIHRFEERELANANQMPAGEGQRYINMIDDERGKILDEYMANPEALKRRLGVGYESGQHTSPNENRLANTVVTTAVQATFLQTIRAIFRL
ncbi:hypothetical protein [Undibacterium umbellatum]|uniref:Uncharacterized protein n=1 Tax=Undibacterium umbellatum TaxID=2762300 RepID=A0ABR6ZF15_9BURK|nr:hypothetical protein [Undibacterium umbellatum]MBC3909812.1 hypothetical protein [Undibacterium umbellatum]